MLEYERMKASGEFDAMPKKEALLLDRELEKLQRNLGGLRDMKKRPDAVFVLDTKKEHIAVTEANKLGIPVVAVVDTNVDPDVVQFPIPGNDDAIRANGLLVRVIAEAVEEGRYIASRRPRPAAAVDEAPARPERSPEDEAAFAQAQAEARNAAARAQADREARLTASKKPAAAAAPAAPVDETAVEETAVDRRPPSRSRCRRAAVEEPRHRRPPTRRRRPPTRSRRRQTSPRPRRNRPTKPDCFARFDIHPHEFRNTDMAFTAQGRKGAAPGHRRRNDGRKRALEATDGDIEAAKQWLREKGLAASAKRDDRENTQGVVALKVDGNVGAMVKLKCETDFVAGSEQFKAEAETLVDLVAAKGTDAVAERAAELDELKITAQGEDRARRRRALRGRRRQRARQLRAHAGRPRRQRRARRDRRRQRRAGPRRRRAHRLRPSEVPAAATTCRPTWSRPSARRWRRSPATRASPRRRCRRSSRVVSTASSRMSACSTSRTPRTTSSRSTRCSASATVVRFAQVEIG